MSTEEKKLDDMQLLFQHADEAKADLFTLMKKVLEGKDYETEKFKASLDNWIAGYASENNLTTSMINLIEKDKEIYDTVGNALKDYIKATTNNENMDISYKEYEKFVTISRINNFIKTFNAFYWHQWQAGVNIHVTEKDLEKLYDLVKYMKLEHIKKENIIEFPKVHFHSRAP